MENDELFDKSDIFGRTTYAYKLILYLSSLTKKKKRKKSFIEHIMVVEWNRNRSSTVYMFTH